MRWSTRRLSLGDGRRQAFSFFTCLHILPAEALCRVTLLGQRAARTLIQRGAACSAARRSLNGVARTQMPQPWNSSWRHGDGAAQWRHGHACIGRQLHHLCCIPSTSALIVDADPARSRCEKSKTPHQSVDHTKESIETQVVVGAATRYQGVAVHAPGRRCPARFKSLCCSLRGRMQETASHAL